MLSPVREGVPAHSPFFILLQSFVGTSRNVDGRRGIRRLHCGMSGPTLVAVKYGKYLAPDALPDPTWVYCSLIALLGGRVWERNGFVPRPNITGHNDAN